VTQIGVISRPSASDEGPGAGQPPNSPDQALVGRTSAAAPGRALVPTTLVSGSARGGADRRPAAAFLAHLIATALRAPQTCARRRAEPAAGSAAYAMIAGRFPDCGRVVCRST
jgi:hypothetical protein